MWTLLCFLQVSLGDISWRPESRGSTPSSSPSPCFTLALLLSRHEQKLCQCHCRYTSHLCFAFIQVNWPVCVHNKYSTETNFCRGSAAGRSGGFSSCCASSATGYTGTRRKIVGLFFITHYKFIAWHLKKCRLIMYNVRQNPLSLWLMVPIPVLVIMVMKIVLGVIILPGIRLKVFAFFSLLRRQCHMDTVLQMEMVSQHILALRPSRYPNSPILQISASSRSLLWSSLLTKGTNSRTVDRCGNRGATSFLS